MATTPDTAASSITELTPEERDAVDIGDYKYGFSNDDSASNYAFKAEKGLNEEIVRANPGVADDHLRRDCGRN